MQQTTLQGVHVPLFQQHKRLFSASREKAVSGKNKASDTASCALPASVRVRCASDAGKRGSDAVSELHRLIQALVSGCSAGVHRRMCKRCGNMRRLACSTCKGTESIREGGLLGMKPVKDLFETLDNTESQVKQIACVKCEDKVHMNLLNIEMVVGNGQLPQVSHHHQDISMQRFPRVNWESNLSHFQRCGEKQ
ncbi:uncharacterized protein LOC114178168 [Vigna unguiculata]|uniref:uncharacterized protein LOC114178168 n=1 Tax=Vigna unguiculata TaxID=3917 RepID=UPI001016D380|nr:uncharacterized protein LOC114178168 [Vigna unguiculata]